MASQASVVQGLLSVAHGTPEDLGTTVQSVPLHVELVSQSPAVQVNEVPPQLPFVHTSFLVQAVASSHVVVLALLVHAVVEVAGSQTWH
jgi:hypothetical protein